MKYHKFLFALLVFSFLIRLISLNQSLWLDEGTTARVVQQYNYFDIITKFSPSDFHPPLFYLFTKLWASIFGYSEVAFRLPSVIFSAIAGYFVFLIGKKIKDEKVGFWAAVFFLLNPLILYYSQEARMYMMVTCFLTIGFYFFLRSLSATNWKNILLCNIFIFLSFLTFYGSLFFIITLYLYLAVKRQWKLLFLLLPGFVVSFIVVSPLLFIQYNNSKQALGLVANWKQVLGTANGKNLLLIPLKFSIGRISFLPKMFYYALSIPWTIILGSTAIVGGLKSKKLLFFLIMPLFFGLLFSLYTPLLQYFRFIYLIVPFSLLLSLGTKKIWQIILVTTGLTLFSFTYLVFPQFHREDWKNMSKLIKPKSTVYMIPSSSDPLIYYRNDIRIVDIRNVQPTDSALIIIPYTTDIYGFPYRQVLNSKGYQLSKEQSFRGVGYEEWKRK